VRVQTPPAVGTNVRVSPADNNHYSETFVAYDQTAHANMLAGSNTITSTRMASASSHDSGASWPNANPVTSPPVNHFGSDPGPVFNSSGSAYYTYIDVERAPSTGNLVGLQLLVNSSSNKGDTWNTTPLARLDSNGQNPDKPLPAVDWTTGLFGNRMYVAYDNNGDLTCTVSCPQPAMISFADPPYTSWTQKTVSTGFGNIGGFPAIGPTGQVYYVWDDYGSTAGGQIVIKKSTDGGNTWSASPTVIAGTTISFGVKLPNYSTSPSTTREVGPAQAVDVDRSNGNAYVVWGDIQSSTGPRMHIFYSRSTNGGASWSAPVRLDTGNVNDAWEPIVAVDQSNGKVTAAWYDRRDDGSNTLYGVYYTQSSDGGQTWLPTQVPVASVQSDPRVESLNGTGDYMGMVAMDGKAHPVWTDSRDGLMRTYTATIDESGVMAVGGPYNSLKKPFRLTDTRQTGGRLGPNSTMDVQVTGRADPSDPTNTVPTGNVGAAVINLLAVDASDGSFLTIYPQGSGGRPLASTLNFVPGPPTANLSQVAVGASGKVTVYNAAGSVDVVADIIGYYSATPASDTHGLFKPIAPVRIADSRSGQGIGLGPIASGQTRDVQVSGSNGITVPGTKSVVVNLTATGSAQTGYLAMFPTGSAAQGQISNVNFGPYRDVPNRVIVGLGTNGVTPGWISVFNGGPSAVDAVIDLNGSFTDNSPGGTGGIYHPFTPVRVFDTRNSSQVGPSGTHVNLIASGFLPSASLKAVALNTTVTNPSSGSYLTVYPDNVSAPLASDLNFNRLDTLANLVIVKVGSDGLNILNAVGYTDVVGDLAGYYS
jgi:hypothetical protein